MDFPALAWRSSKDVPDDIVRVRAVGTKEPFGFVVLGYQQDGLSVWNSYKPDVLTWFLLATNWEYLSCIDGKWYPCKKAG